MTESEWLTEQARPQYMVWTLLKPGKLQRTKAGKRKLRLFGCGCCRLIWPLLTNPRSRQAVALAEQFADGQADKDELQQAFLQNLELTFGGYQPTDPGVQQRIAAHMALSTTAAKAISATFDMTAFPLPLAGFFGDEQREQSLLCDLLRCVFGTPFRPPTLPPAWRTRSVTALAQSIYDDRTFDRLPILADALEEAGCTDADILGHCRGPGPHVRGCWVVDLLLGKQ